MATLVREPFVTAALARGVGERAVYVRHLMRPACSLVVSYAALQLGYLLGGSLVMETVFGYPGIGRLAVEALSARDLPVLMAAAACSALGFLALRFAADLALLWLDPRVRDGVLA
jgi:peptide/nickel transport system permease protein